MSLQLSVTLALFLAGMPDSTVGSVDECPVVYQIVAATAVTILPDPMRPFFAAHLDELNAGTTTGAVSAYTATHAVAEEDWHYVMLDVAAETMAPGPRQAAARSFPHDRAAAENLFRRHRQRNGGVLPWIVADRCSHLVTAFQGHDEASVVREAGVVLHLTADASLPFNTTVDREGKKTGNLSWEVDDAAGANRMHHTVRHRFQYALIQRLRPRFECEVRVWPNRRHHIANPVEAVFSVLLDANADLDALLALDREIVAALGIVDSDTFAPAEDVYYERFADRAATMMESRLEAAALLGANLIGSAWIDAGMPPLTQLAGAPSSLITPQASQGTGEDRFVGSRNSGVFHKATCPHAKRINPKNLMTFPTVQDARSAGRRPCKTCTPDAP